MNKQKMCEKKERNYNFGHYFWLRCLTQMDALLTGNMDQSSGVFTVTDSGNYRDEDVDDI